MVEGFRFWSGCIYAGNWWEIRPEVRFKNPTAESPLRILVGGGPAKTWDE
jgi:hypothetical protein